MTEESSRFRRWHDNRAELSLLIALLEEIPPEVLPLITDALTEKADQEFQVGALLNSMKSLGAEKIMALHKSQKKQRSYDQNQYTHKIANYFYMIPEAEQESFASRFLEFTAIMVEYLANCDSFELQPEEAHLRKMRDLFVSQGEIPVRDYLMEIHQPYYERLLAADPEPPSLTETSQGMLLREKEL